MTTTLGTDEQRQARLALDKLRAAFGTHKLKRFLAAMHEQMWPPLGMDARGNRFGRDQEPGPNGSAPAGNVAAQMRLAIEEALGSHENLPEGLVKQIFTLLEKHAPLNGDEEPLGEMQELRRREEMPPALDVEAFSKALREYGVNADDESVKRALDDMPMNALHGGSLGRGGGPGGVFAAKRAGERGGGAMDSAASKFNISRIIVGDAGLAERAGGRQPTMSAAQQRRFEERFPHIARTY